MKTVLGVEVGTEETEALLAANTFTHGILRLDCGAERIVTAAHQYPQLPLLQLYAAGLHLFGQTAGDQAKADAFLTRAEKCLQGNYLTQLGMALRLWHQQNYLAAVGHFEKITEAYPSDLLSAKFAEFLYYILGQQHFGTRFLNHMVRLEDVHREHPDYLSMRAFAHELCGHFPEATEFASRSITLEARNPWAEHALTHVLIREGKIQEGIRRMEQFLPLLKTCGRIAYCHDSWHLALLYLEQCNFAEAERVLRQQVWTPEAGSVTELIDAISLVWRMEMAGWHEFGDWSTLADRAEATLEPLFMPFLSAHQAYALARAERGDSLARLDYLMTEKVRQEQENGVWSRVGRAVVLACADAGRGRWESMAHAFDAQLPHLTELGGSDAQDDIFRQAYFLGLCAIGKKDEASRYWQRASGEKQLSPLDDYLLEQSHAG